MSLSLRLPLCPLGSTWYHSRRTIKMFLTCFICKADVNGTYAKLVEHFRHAHSMRTSNQVRAALKCGQGQCQQVLDSFGSLRYHMLHCDFARANLGTINMEESQKPVRALLELDNEGGYDAELQNPVARRELDHVIRLTTLMMLNMRAKHNVTHVALNYMCESLQLIVQEIKQGNVEENLNLISAALKQNNSQAKR